MFTLKPLCQEGQTYVEEQLLLRGFDKRGKLFIRRSGVIVSTVYPCWEHGQLEDYIIGIWPIWWCPDTIAMLRGGNGMQCRVNARRITHGSIPEPTPEYPFRKITKMSYPLLNYYLRGFPEDSLRQRFGADFQELRWDHIQEVLDCTLLAPLDYRATYEGERAYYTYLRQTRHFFSVRNFLMYEKNLSALQQDIKMEQKFRDECLQQYGFYPDTSENKYQQSLPILEAAESGDWGPAEQYLAEKSARALALLKRYHVEDKGPYPREFARLRYDN